MPRIERASGRFGAISMTMTASPIASWSSTPTVRDFASCMMPSWSSPRPSSLAERIITSEGMILSAKELGLGEDHDGIMQLAKSLTVGVLLQDAIGDAVIVMEIAPNRPDALSILGIAREVAALYNVKLTEPRAAELPGKLDPSLLTIR